MKFIWSWICKLASKCAVIYREMADPYDIPVRRLVVFTLVLFMIFVMILCSFELSVIISFSRSNLFCLCS
jgi:hypothetical protein